MLPRLPYEQTASMSSGIPFTCNSCGAVLGQCHRAVLDLGTVRVRWTVRLECRRCGRWRRWSPSPRQSKDIRREVQRAQT